MNEKQLALQEEQMKKAAVPNLDRYYSRLDKLEDNGADKNALVKAIDSFNLDRESTMALLDYYNLFDEWYQGRN